jgi:hypothetical protein
MNAAALWRDRHACVVCFLWFNQSNERTPQCACEPRAAPPNPKQVFDRFCGVIYTQSTSTNLQVSSITCTVDGSPHKPFFSLLFSKSDLLADLAYDISHAIAQRQ